MASRPTSNEDLCYLTAVDALSLFRSRSLSPIELLEAQLARLDAVGDRLNAFSFLYAEEALAAAADAEARYRDGGDARPLEGLPVAIKDESLIAGKITSFGSLIYKDTVATETSPVNERLLEAGIVVTGRTTTPEFSCAGFTHSRAWGVTRNPWNPDFTPGGSSGGSGAALAAGLVTLASGSDIGGSIRIPASACGLVGFKPPYGRNPDLPPFNLDSYNHPGPMARSVGDCLLMQNVMAGPHPGDIASLKPKLELLDRPADLRGRKVAWSMDLGYVTVDAEVRRNTKASLDVFRSLGAELVEVDLGWTRASERAADQHLGTIFGAWVDQYLDTHGALMTRYATRFGERARTLTTRDYLQSLEVAAGMYATFGRLMEGFDAFVCPTLAVPAVAADFDVDAPFAIDGQPVDAAMGWLMTYPFNMLSRCPVLSVPSGRAENGVPTGIQIVGKSYCDQDVFGIGLAYEAAAAPWYASPDRRPRLS